jgi:hypothetical protein
MAKCNCFEETLVKVKDHIKTQLPSNATEVEIDWDQRIFLLSGGDHAPVSPKLKVEYRGVKRNGEPNKNLTKDTVSMLASHCCFCGREYVKEEKANG